MNTLASAADNSSSGEIDTVRIPGGRALIGTNFPVFPGDGEGPLREEHITPFRMTPTAIANRQFTAFVRETGYKTEAKRFGWSFLFKGALSHTRYVEDQVAALPWWCKVERNLACAERTGIDGRRFRVSARCSR